VLNIMEHRYTEDRLVNIAGDYMTKEIQTFKGDSLSGNRNTKISLGSAMPTSRQARQTFILELAQKGFIDKPRAMELLEFAQEEGLYHDVSRNGEKTEIARMAKGDTNVVPKPWENHAARLAILTNFMQTPDFEKLGPDICNIFIAHMKAHQQMLMAEMQTARGPGGAPGAQAPQGAGAPPQSPKEQLEPGAQQPNA
jgi:hypothetical protein